MRSTPRQRQRDRGRTGSGTGRLALWCLAALAACGDGGTPPAGGAPVATTPAPAGTGSAGSARGFNLLLVTFDTVRADAIGCYGGVGARTPVVDRLAQHGVRFAQAVASAPITLPSHATLMTGLEPPHHGVRNNGTFRLAPEHVTLAERLSASGYDTGAVVGAFVLGKSYGLAQGFDFYDDQVGQGGTQAAEGHYLQRTADKVTDSAVAWLRDRSETPFFLWVHYFDAHAPYEPPAAFVPATPHAEPMAVYDPAATRARYQGEVAFADAELGRLLEALGEERSKRTLVVFTSDHGEGLGEHAEFTHTRLVHEATMRVPLVLSCPALFERDYVVEDRLAGLVDVMPTVLALLDVEPGSETDGLRLLDTPPDPERAIYGESLVPLFNHGWAPLYSLRRLHDKFVQAPRPEYYDLRSDPLELRNLYSTSQPRAVELQGLLGAHRARTQSDDGASESGLAPEEARRLAALGYGRSTPSGREIGVLDPKDMLPTWAALTNAQTYSAQGDFARALADVERVLALNPNDAFAWEAAYVVNLRRKALPEAEVAVRRMLELNPTSDGYIRLAQLALQLGELDECDAALASAAELEPTHGEVYLVRGDRFLQAELHDLAREQYERAREIDPVRASAGAQKGLDYLDSLGR